MNKDEFLFAKGTLPGDATFLDIAQADNLHRFVTRLSYLNAAVAGGKLTPKQASKDVKELYKRWKSSNKSLESSFNA